MTVSKKLTLNAAGDAVAIANATLGDTITSILDPDIAITGAYKWVQMALAVGVGGALDRRVTTGAFGIPFMKVKS